MNKLFIGIDCDVDKNGVATWDGKNLTLQNLRFFELFDYLHLLQIQWMKVIIEAGWLHDKSNWHKQGQGERVASRIGKNTGANHEAGRKIVEMCEYLGIDYELRKPMSTKMNAKEFKMITKYEGKTNQEERDAAMLIFGLK